MVCPKTIWMLTWWFQRFYCFSPTYANYTWYNRTTFFQRPSSNVCGCSMQLSPVQISTATDSNSSTREFSKKSFPRGLCKLAVSRFVNNPCCIFDVDSRYSIGIFLPTFRVQNCWWKKTPLRYKNETPNEIKRIQIWSVYHVIKHLNMSSSQIASVPAFFFKILALNCVLLFLLPSKCLFVKSLDHPRWWSSSFPANLRTSP